MPKSGIVDAVVFAAISLASIDGNAPEPEGATMAPNNVPVPAICSPTPEIFVVDES